MDMKNLNSKPIKEVEKQIIEKDFKISDVIKILSDCISVMGDVDVVLSTECDDIKYLIIKDIAFLGCDLRGTPSLIIAPTLVANMIAKKCEENDRKNF